VPTAPLDHRGQKRCREAHRRKQVDLHQSFPLRLWHIGNDAAQAQPGVIDQNIDTRRDPVHGGN
jgi:hypothetical protein